MENVLEAFPGGLEEAQRALKSRCEELAKEARAMRHRLGLAYGTPASAVQSKFTHRSSSYEVFDALNPTFATGGDPEAAEQAREARAQFVSEYARCKALWRAGDRNVIWPAGTWKMRVLHRCRCHPPSITLAQLRSIACLVPGLGPGTHRCVRRLVGGVNL